MERDSLPAALKRPVILSSCRVSPSLPIQAKTGKLCTPLLKKADAVPEWNLSDGTAAQKQVGHT